MPRRSFRERVTPFVKTYCLECHGNRKSKAGINFEVALRNPGDAASSRQWKQAFANVKAHDMPPDDADKQPTDEERQMFLDWIGKIKFLSPKDPGPFVIRRLTKVEYGNTLHDLFGVDPAVAEELPDEVFGEGYLNTLSPLQSEQYLGIANEVLDRILAPQGCAAHGGAEAPVRRTARARGGSPGGGEKCRPLAGPQRLSPAAVGGGSWMSCWGSSIWRAKTNSPTRRRCA